MREFLELTEQSQKLQIQFQHVSITNRKKFIRFLVLNFLKCSNFQNKLNLKSICIIMYHVRKTSEHLLLTLTKNLPPSSLVISCCYFLCTSSWTIY